MPARPTPSRRAVRPPSLSKYPHLTRVSGIANGAPVVRGTRTTVRAIAEYHQRVGMSAAEIVAALPYLHAAEVHTALAYYFDHQAEVDAEIDAENDFETLHALSGGRLRRFEPPPEP